MPQLLHSGQVDLLQAGLSRLMPVSESAAELFYRKLFELDPALRPLFKADIDVQGRKFMHTLAHLVQGLYRIDWIRPSVEQLGRDHVRYGVRPEHYATARTALLWALDRSLGAALTTDEREAWGAAYDLLAEIMIDGAREEGGGRREQDSSR